LKYRSKRSRSLVREKKDLYKTILKLQGKHQSLEDDYRDLQSRPGSSESYKTENNLVQAQIENLQQLFIQLKIENEFLREELKELKIIDVSLEGQFGKLMVENEFLEGQLVQLKSEEQSLIEKLSQTRGETETLQGQFYQLKSETEFLKRKLEPWITQTCEDASIYGLTDEITIREIATFNSNVSWCKILNKQDKLEAITDANLVHAEGALSDIVSILSLMKTVVVQKKLDSGYLENFSRQISNISLTSS